MGFFSRALFLPAVLLAVVAANAQEAAKLSPFNRKHEWTVFTEYSPISGEYVPDGGDVAHHAWIAVGASARWRVGTFGGGALSYQVEFRPVALSRQTLVNEATTIVGMPQYGTSYQTFLVPACTAGTTSLAFNGVTFLTNTTCSHEWVYGEQFSPFGWQENFRVRGRLQPVAVVSGGMLLTTQAIPDANSGTFHFTIAFGAGVEYYRQKRGAIQVDVRDQHYSNAYTSLTNYGTDNIVLHAGYSF